MKSSIGHMRERITVLVPAHKKDTMGGYTVSWARKGTLWAHVAPQTNNSPTEDQKGWRKPFYKIRIRSDHEIAPSMRIRWREKLLKVTSEPTYSLTMDAIEFSALEIKKGSSDDE